MVEYDPFAVFETTSEIVQEIATTTTTGIQLTEFQKGLLLGFLIYYLLQEM